MSYTAPNNTAVDFEFQSYSSSTNTSVDFTFGKTSTQTSVAAVISQSTATAGLSETVYSSPATVSQSASVSSGGTQSTTKATDSSIITTVSTINTTNSISLVATAAKSTVTASVSETKYTSSVGLTVPVSVTDLTSPSRETTALIGYSESVSIQTDLSDQRNAPIPVVVSTVPTQADLEIGLVATVAKSTATATISETIYNSPVGLDVSTSVLDLTDPTRSVSVVSSYSETISVEAESGSTRVSSVEANTVSSAQTGTLDIDLGTILLQVQTLSSDLEPTAVAGQTYHIDDSVTVDIEQEPQSVEYPQRDTKVTYLDKEQ